MTSLPQMFTQLRFVMELTQADLAQALGCSPQFICDLEKGKRTPSVAFIENLCRWLGRGPKGRREWHIAAARAHGWDV